MSDSSYQNERPKARVNIRLDLHTGGARKKVELPPSLLVTGDSALIQMETKRHLSQLLNRYALTRHR